MISLTSGYFVRFGDKALPIEDMADEDFQAYMAGKSTDELVRWVDSLRKMLKRRLTELDAAQQALAEKTV